MFWRSKVGGVIAVFSSLSLLEEVSFSGGSSSGCELVEEMVESAVGIR